MRNVIYKLFNKKREGDKISTLVEKVDGIVMKIDELKVKVETVVVDGTEKQLNSNRRFFLEKGTTESYGRKYITYIAIRDRHHADYKSSQSDIKYENKDVIYYVKSDFTGNNYNISYYMSQENMQQAEEVEMHLDALERLGVLSHFVLNK